MPKSTWLLAISGLFLAASLIWVVPAFAQLQSGSLLKSHKQDSGTSSGGSLGHSGTMKKSRFSSDNKLGWKNPDQDKKQAPYTLTPAKTDHQPQSQTPGGTKIP